jgi:tetratricopeptide (TPR) repeat protein
MNNEGLLMAHLRTTMPAAGVFLALAMLVGCAGTPQTDQLRASSAPRFEQPVELTDVPFFAQERYQCGPAALATVLDYAGEEVTPAQLKPDVYLPGKHGSLQIEMLAAVGKRGLLAYQLRPKLTDLLEEVRQGRPVLVFQNLGLSWYPRWHYAVVVGFDVNADEVILRSGTTRRHRVSFETFEHTWQRAKYWAMVVLRPGQMPVNPDALRYARAVVALEQNKKFIASKTAYRAGIEQWPHNQTMLMGLGNLCYANGEARKARRYYERVLQDHPDYAPAHNNLAQVLAEQGAYDEALRHVERAIELGGVYKSVYQSTLDEIQNRRAQNRK